MGKEIVKFCRYHQKDHPLQKFQVVRDGKTCLTAICSDAIKELNVSHNKLQKTRLK